MRFIISILLTLTFSVLTVKVEAKETNNVRYNIQSNLYLGAATGSRIRSFTMGDSLEQRQEQAEAEQIRLASLHTRSGKAYGGSASNPYPYGWCTWYVAEEKDIHTNYGNARNWPINSSEPQAGAVVITSESPRGHVAYVESVEGNEIVVSEMNYAGWGKVSTRVINKNARFIRGYLI